MAESALRTSDLFDADFIASVKRLQILAHRVARGGLHAEQRSRDMGSGVEFRVFRPYSSGDDFRAIDWNIYRRLGRVFLRLFEELEDLPLYVLPDISDSMWFEDPPRAKAGLRTGLALAAIALQQHDRVGLFPFGANLEVAMRPTSGKARLMRIAEVMASFRPAGATDIAASLGRFNAMKLREGLVVIISDFFDPAGLDVLEAALKRARHRLLLVQLVRSSDRRPGVSGDLELVDCESGEAAEVSATPAVLDHYQRAYESFRQRLVAIARARSAGMLLIDVDEEITPQLASLFETGSYIT